jgi:hypothetical protein
LCWAVEAPLPCCRPAALAHALHTLAAARALLALLQATRRGDARPATPGVLKVHLPARGALLLLCPLEPRRCLLRADFAPHRG